MDIQPQHLALAGIVYVGSVVAAYLVAKFRANKLAGEFKSLSVGLDGRRQQIQKADADLARLTDTHASLNEETAKLQQLQGREQELVQSVREQMQKAAAINKVLQQLDGRQAEKEAALKELLTKLDLYMDIEEVVDHGHFDMPDYLYETSDRFAEEIKIGRERQKELIKSGEAVTYPESTTVSDDAAVNKRILSGQVKLMLTAFNIECDSLIGKVKPSTFPATLERIEKLANSLEKSAGSLACGFNIEYVRLKFEECRLQYQYMLKKQDEIEEQRAIREQIREEQRAIKEYEKAVADAEKEEKLYRDLLAKAQEELQSINEEERAAAEARIAALEAQLAEAEAKEQRAKSMAEQTRKGHVYVISNVGSFGKDVYKIGLTRRLDPMDRVKELGDASVPFSFDVHAMIYVDDAPALETALHREFTEKRVNLVNQRKEFFTVSLGDVKDAVSRIAGVEADFRTTIAAEEYYESQRLRGAGNTRHTQAVQA